MESELNPENEKGYDISEDKFLETPSEIKDWRIGEQITRENFVSFLIQSYAISRGIAMLHKIFFIWLEKKFGFDYQSTINNFVSSGGWRAMGEAEKQKFLAAFGRVAKHSENFSQNDIENEIQNEIDGLRGTLILVEGPSVKEFFDLDHIDSLSEFNESAGKFIKNYRMINIMRSGV